MEEQRQRQEDEQRRAQVASAQDGDASGSTPADPPAVAATSDETMLERVLAISETPVKRNRVRFTSIFMFGLILLLKFCDQLSSPSFLPSFYQLSLFSNYSNNFQIRISNVLLEWRRDHARFCKYDRGRANCVCDANVNAGYT